MCVTAPISDIRRIIPEGWRPKGPVSLVPGALQPSPDPEPTQQGLENIAQPLGDLTRFAPDFPFHTGVLAPSNPAVTLQERAFLP